MSTEIVKPVTLTACALWGVPQDRKDWTDAPTFIVLSFGSVEVGRWEWQADVPLESRTDPSHRDVATFVATKLRAVLFPEPESS